MGLASIALALGLAACGSSSTDSVSSASTSSAAADAVTSTVKPPAKSTTGTPVALTTTPSTTASSTSTPSTTTPAPKTAPAPAATSPAATPVTATPPAAPAVPAPVTTPPPAVIPNSKSISAWVSCTGTADDTSGAMQAFAAAKNGAFTLVVDCPVLLHSGLAVDRGIFIDNGTSVQFTGAGKFFVDNMFHPAFVIANSSNITLTNWNVEWDGSVPINPDFGGYYLNGQWVAEAGITQPAEGFNDVVLTNWLASNRAINFDESQGWIKSIWVGGVNPAAVFFITGASTNVVFKGLNLYAPATAGGNQFIPMAFSSSANWRSNQTVTGQTAETTQYAAVPSGITFSNLSLDGVLMGWQGNLQNATFQNITSHRYGDLQDANGNNVGGIGKWFPPPHLFYINTHATDPGLNNINVQFSDITDYGIRIGVARDTSSSNMSGYADSLKLGCTNCSVNNYTSHRPDGFMDVLPADGMTITNVTATFDTAFLNNLYPAGLRFPKSGYTNVTFQNVQLTDTAPTTLQGPIGNATDSANAHIVFEDFLVTMNQWSGSELPLPSITGANNDVLIDFAMTAQATKIAYLQENTTTLMLESSPAIVSPGGSSVLTWSSNNATSCSAGGAWSGSVSGSGSRSVAIGAAGTYSYSMTCQNSASGTYSTALAVVAQ
jgi:hypothetical protein